MTHGMVKNLMKIYAYGKPFYASDLHLNGGEVGALSTYNYIKPTGKTHKVMVKLETWRGDIYKECAVKEWELVKGFNPGMDRMFAESFARAIQDAKDVLAAAAKLGFEGF